MLVKYIAKPSFFYCFIYLCVRCSSEGLYFTKVAFNTLTTSELIRATKVYDDLQCLLQCKRSESCLSVNVAVQPDDDGWHECVLLKDEMSRSTGNLKPSKVYHHYSRIQDTCASGCMNNGSCQSLINDFRCHCPQGFMGKRCERSRNKKWLKINASPVCFGAKNSAFGSFYIKENGSFSTVKLVHLSGYVMCNYKYQSTRSNWGCGPYIGGNNKNFPDRMFTIITDDKHQKILPQDEFIKKFTTLETDLPGGYTSQSLQLIFPNLTTMMSVTAGQEYRIWYGQDLKDTNEDMNDGTACVDVYMYGVFEESH